MSIWETAHGQRLDEAGGDWTNVLSVTFITLAEAGWQKDKNIFPTKRSLHFRS